VSLVLGKLAELSETHPGQVWRVDVEREPGKGAETMAVHLPKAGGQGGWYVQIGSLVLPAPIADVKWEGDRVTGTLQAPGQPPQPFEATLDGATGELILKMGGGTIRAQPMASSSATRQVASAN
jgi:hypothetical protein